MDNRNKNLLISFIDLCYINEVIKDDLSKSKDKVEELLKKIDKQVDRNLFIELEQELGEYENLLKYRFFEYGMVANETIECTNLDHSPYKVDAI